MNNPKKKSTTVLILALVALLLITTITVATNPSQASVKRHSQLFGNSSFSNSTNVTLTNSVTQPNIKLLG